MGKGRADPRLRMNDFRSSIRLFVLRASQVRCRRREGPRAVHVCVHGTSQLQQPQAPLTPNRKAEIQQSATTPLRPADCSTPAAFASDALSRKHKPQPAAQDAACIRAAAPSQARHVLRLLCATLRGINRSHTNMLTPSGRLQAHVSPAAPHLSPSVMPPATHQAQAAASKPASMARPAPQQSMVRHCPAHHSTEKTASNHLNT